nr:hypothetical protein [Nocardioides convexus]
MAGGSADAAATLLALDRLWDLQTSDEDLLRIAGTLGSDVPFALLGGTALGTGRGESRHAAGGPLVGVVGRRPLRRGAVHALGLPALRRPRARRRRRAGAAGRADRGPRRGVRRRGRRPAPQRPVAGGPRPAPGPGRHRGAAAAPRPRRGPAVRLRADAADAARGRRGGAQRGGRA